MTIDHGQINTRERAISNDWNRQVELGNRGIVEALSAAVSSGARESGVIGENGFLCSPQPGTMKTAIGPGLALYYDATKVFPQSQMVWVESREIREVTHEAADGLARWDVIEMQPGSMTSSTQPRDQFDPLTGTFSVVNMVKEVKSYPTFQIRKGAPSATPGAPAGVAGWIPLAYVQIPGGAVAVDPTKIVYCRPLLGDRGVGREGWTTSPLNGAFASNVKGGGVNFPGGGIANGTIQSALQGRFGATAAGMFHHNFRVSNTVAVKITSMTYDGGGLPAADQVVYFYAIPAPYPAGYDSSLAGRELWTPDPANLYGVNGGFYDQGLQSDCIIISSTKEPSVVHSSGASTGIGEFDHEFFNVAGPAESFASSWVYIGAAFYDQATGFVIAQNTRQAWVSGARKTGKGFDADLPIAAPITYNMWTKFVGGLSMQLPVTATRLSMQAACTLAADDSIHVEIEDTWRGQGNGTVNGAITFDLRNNAVGSEIVRYNFEAMVSDTGTVKIEEATVNGINSTCDLVARAYQDAVLAQR